MNKLLMPRVSLAAMMAARPFAVIGGVRADASDGSKIEQLLKDVKAELTRVGDDVKRTAEDALKQAKQSGTLSAETKATADKLMADQNKLNESLQALQKKLDEQADNNLSLEQKLASLRQGGGLQRRKSVGQQVTESDDFKGFVTRGAKGTMRTQVNLAITSADGSAGDLIWSDREEGEIVRLPRRQMTIRQLLTPGRTTSNAIEYAKQTTRTNNAAPVTEGEQKPESNYVWDQATALVRTIAHWVPVSRQAMDDAPLLQSEIDGELRYGLDLAEELQLLKGDGTGQNLSGLVTEATAYSAEFTPTSEQRIDTLRLAMLQAALAEYPASGIVIHPTDWTQIELLKDGENRYLWANPRGSQGPGLWGLPVIDTQSMDEGEFLVGAFMMAATIYDRMDAEVLISSEDRDNFIKNMLTVRAEKRLALAVKRPAALVTGEFPAVSG